MVVGESGLQHPNDLGDAVRIVGDGEKLVGIGASQVELVERDIDADEKRNR